jgi:hypothetical protein
LLIHKALRLIDKAAFGGAGAQLLEGAVCMHLQTVGARPRGNCVGLQTPPKDRTTTTSIEDLLNTKVSSVSKTEHKLSKTASAIFVMIQEDIRRPEATNIRDLLPMVRGKLLTLAKTKPRRD